MRRLLLGLGLLAFVVFMSQPADAQLRRSDVTDVLRAHVDDIRTCYETSLTGGGPTLSGRIIVEVIVRPNGRVRKALILRSTLRRPRIEQCIQRKVSRLRFRASGAVSTFRYPFVFRPGA